MHLWGKEEQRSDMQFSRFLRQPRKRNERSLRRRRCPRAVSFASFFAAQRKRPAGGDGGTEWKADASGESAEGRRNARTGGGREQDEGISPAGDPPFSPRRKVGERRAGGPFHKGPPDPSSRPRAPPHWIPGEGYEGRETKGKGRETEAEYSPPRPGDGR